MQRSKIPSFKKRGGLASEHVLKVFPKCSPTWEASEEIIVTPRERPEGEQQRRAKSTEAGQQSPCETPRRDASRQGGRQAGPRNALGTGVQTH